jgi:hypothetical protein
MAAQPQKNSPFQRAAAFLLLCAFLLSGCGDVGSVAGVGSGGTGGGPTVTYLLAGRVADGYLSNAVVILDKNENYQLDRGEPYAITDENGAYTLRVDPADVGKYPIVAIAIKGLTVDSDTNQPVAHTYVLSIAKESVHGLAGNFISPISSQLREMMETGKYASLYEAADVLKEQMGLPTNANLLTDYVATSNRTVHTAAQNLASVMGGQAGQVITAEGPVVGVDVASYRCMMAAINKNMSTVVDGNTQGVALSIAQEMLKCSGTNP